MPTPRKRPLADPKQYYAYTWMLRKKIVLVGYGHNNRCRVDCKASWSGRSEACVQMLQKYATK